MLLDDLRATLDNVKPLPDRNYLSWPLPSGVDDDISALVALCAEGDARLRYDLIHSLTRHQSEVLTGFAIRMAILGVREQSVARLRIGLLAMAFGGSSPESDWRDIMSDMPPLEDAGMRIRGDSRPAFREAASLATDRTAMSIRIASPPKHAWLGWAKHLKPVRMGDWQAVQAPDGFRYVVKNPVTEAELMTMVEKALRESPNKPS